MMPETEQPKRDPCLKFACEMQKCLQNSSYNESKCANVLLKIKKCCDDNYGSGSRRILSPTCSGFKPLTGKFNENGSF